MIKLIVFLVPLFVSGCHGWIPGMIDMESPRIISSDVPFTVKVFFPTTTRQHNLLNKQLYYRVLDMDRDEMLFRIGRLDTRTLYNGVKGRGHERGFPMLIGGIMIPEGNPLGRNQLRIWITNSTRLAKDEKLDSGHFHYFYDFEVYCIPSWLTLLPSVVTVVIAVLFKQSVLALFVGIFVGSTLICYYNPVQGLAQTLDTVIIKGMADLEHCSVIYFCLMMGGMIAVVGRGGGAAGMAKLATRFASTRKRGQLMTWMVGVLTFFDDYASCLIAGSTMKDITGRLLISREKFSFIVDTCAATVSSLVIVSSWIGVELTYLSEELRNIGAKPDAYMTFIETIPYRFYPLLVLFFCLMTIVTNRDFGPMLTAERRAVQTGKLVKDGSTPLSATEDGNPNLLPKPDKPQKWFNAVVPFVVVVLIIICGLIVEGYFRVSSQEAVLEQKIKLAHRNQLVEYASMLEGDKSRLKYTFQAFFSEGSPFHALLWGSFMGTFVAACLLLSQKILTLEEIMESWVAGAKSMLLAIVILIHAWALGLVCKELQTSNYMADLVMERVYPGLLPAIIFVVAALVSVSTGSAWGTMSILFPLVVPVTDAVAPKNWTLMLSAISSILSGAVWGNHTSPIADSCIMTSMACGSDHLDHVKTQGVYVVVIGLLSIATCSLPVGFNVYPCYVGLLIGCTSVVVLLYGFGRSPEDKDHSYPVTRLVRNHTFLCRCSLLSRFKGAWPSRPSVISI